MMKEGVREVLALLGCLFIAAAIILGIVGLVSWASSAPAPREMTSLQRPARACKHRQRQRVLALDGRSARRAGAHVDRTGVDGMRTPPRRPRITRKAQKASQDERKTTHPDDWKQCSEKFFWWHNKSHYSEVQCGKQIDHDGHEHKAKVKGGVVRWRTKPARAAESPS